MLAKKALSRVTAKKTTPSTPSQRLRKHITTAMYKPTPPSSQPPVLTLRSYVLPTAIGPFTVCLDAAGAVRWCDWLDKDKPSLTTSLAALYPHHTIHVTACPMKSEKAKEEKEEDGKASSLPVIQSNDGKNKEENEEEDNEPHAMRQLRAYFTAPPNTPAHTLQQYLDAITVVMPPRASPFVALVRQTLRESVPAGQVTTYGELALRAQQLREKKSCNTPHKKEEENTIHRHPAARAVGQAMATNPVCVIVPCHRCLDARHTVHGYGCGLYRKVWLLRHEHAPVAEDELRRYEDVQRRAMHLTEEKQQMTEAATSHSSPQHTTPTTPPPPTTTTTRKTIKGKSHGHSIVSLTCPYCGKLFRGDATSSSVRGSYRRHLLVHTKERPYVCIYCSAGFTNRHNMRRHIRCLHPDKMTPVQGPQPAPAAAATAATAITATTATTVTGEEEHITTNGAHSAELSECCSCNHTDGASLSTSCALPPARHRTEGRWQLRCKHCGRAFKRSDSHASHQRSCPRRTTHSASKGNGVKTADITRREGQECQTSTHVSPPPSSLQQLPPALQLPRSTCHAAMPSTRCVCPDCELEVTNAVRLKAHMRYFCPFRDDAFADPLQDAMRHVQNEREYNNDNSSSDEEIRRGRRLAEQTGLAFYEDANRSGDEQQRSSSSNSSSSCTISVCNTTREIQPMHMTSTISDTMDEAEMFGPEYWQRYLRDFARHRKGQRRRRRILLKRLRASQQQQQQEEEDSVVSCISASDVCEDSCGSDEEEDREEAVGERCTKRRRRYAQPLQHVCPFDGCQQNFRTRRFWLAHVMRCHPTEYATLQAAVSTAQ